MEAQTKPNIIAVIPAKMSSKNFPGKPMADILGMPMIGHVYNRVEICNDIDDVYVATSDRPIIDYISKIGGQYIEIPESKISATDRVAEAVTKIEEKTPKKRNIGFYVMLLVIVVALVYLLANGHRLTAYQIEWLAGLGVQCYYRWFVDADGNKRYDRPSNQPDDSQPQTQTHLPDGGDYERRNLQRPQRNQGRSRQPKQRDVLFTRADTISEPWNVVPEDETRGHRRNEAQIPPTV